LIVEKEKISANGEYNLSGERYREGAARDAAFPHVRLDAIAEIAAGNSAPQGDGYFKDGEFPFVRTSDVGVVHLSDNFLGTADKVNQKAIDELRLRLFPAGTILFPKSGASTFLNHRVVMGKAAYVSSHLACIICDETKALPKYVYSLLCSVDARQITPDQAYPSLRLTEIGSIEIPLPPLEVQKEIVAEIEGYQKVINGARAVLDNYRPHIPIHPDWPIVELGEVAQVTSGYSFNSKDFAEANPIRSIKIANVGVREFVADDVSNLPAGFCDKYPDFVVHSGDLVIALTRSIISTGLKIAVVPPEYHRALLNQRVASIREKKNHSDNKFIYFSLCSDSVYRYIEEKARSLMQPNLSIVDLKKLKIPIPPFETQQAIVAEIEAEQALVSANRELVERFEKKIQAALARVWGES
jgi:type I restriction enzyme M protein